MKYFFAAVLTLTVLTQWSAPAAAQNPLIMNQYTADPSARVFGDKVYVYPSHDIRATPGHGRVGWFCMQDYHVFSSSNLTDWTDHGMILSQYTVPWADSTAYSMWAPDCIARNGKYYFYFPTIAKGGVNGKGFTVGVAVGEKPSGPFKPEPEPIKGIHGIDPNVFIDKDGQAYLYWAQGQIYGAKLKDNMVELASDPVVLHELPNKGLKEGPYLFERNGTYYLTYPHVENRIERLEYATSNSPLGPFKFTGVIMDEAPSNCWTNHQSIIRFKGQWYLFYHDDQLSPNFDKNRSIRADSLFFNEDGTIRKVERTLRGVGLTRANKEIQIDRYSAISPEGVTIDYIDTANRMQGWKATFDKPGAWLRYNAVDFAKGGWKDMSIRATTTAASTVEVRLDGPRGILVALAKLAANRTWRITNIQIAKAPKGKHDLFVLVKSGGPVSIDWLKFN